MHGITCGCTISFVRNRAPKIPHVFQTKAEKNLPLFKEPYLEMAFKNGHLWNDDAEGFLAASEEWLCYSCL